MSSFLNKFLQNAGSPLTPPEIPPEPPDPEVNDDPSQKPLNDGGINSLSMNTSQAEGLNIPSIDSTEANKDNKMSSGQQPTNIQLNQSISSLSQPPTVSQSSKSSTSQSCINCDILNVSSIATKPSDTEDTENVIKNPNLTLPQSTNSLDAEPAANVEASNSPLAIINTDPLLQDNDGERSRSRIKLIKPIPKTVASEVCSKLSITRKSSLPPTVRRSSITSISSVTQVQSRTMSQNRLLSTSISSKSSQSRVSNCAIIVPAMKNNGKSPNATTKKGHVKRIMDNNVSGLIDANLMENRLVFFHLNQISNYSIQEVRITVGSCVEFDLEPNGKNKEKPKAVAIYVGCYNEVNNEQSNTMVILPKKGWRKGTTCPNINEKFLYVKPDDGYEHGNNKDVFVHADKISLYVLKIQAGDKMEYILSDRDTERPMARKVRILFYLSRNSSELINYFACLIEHLSSTNMHNVLEDILNNLAQWNFFSSLSFENSGAFDNYFYPYIHCLTVIIRKAKRFHKEQLEDVMKCVMKGVLFSPADGEPEKQWLSYFKDLSEPDFNILNGSSRIEIISDFLICLAQEVPSIKDYLQPILKCVCKSFPSTETQNLLFNVCLLIIQTDKKYDLSLDVNWNQMPICITNEELNGSLVSEDKHLSQVKYGPFESEEDYMDTYFRLLRTETFESIQKGIQDFKCHKLDKRDMNVYWKVFVVGTYMNNSGLSIAVTFLPDKPVRDWSKSSQLMFGNLVCLSPKQDFANPIWATVAERDPEILKKKQVIMLELSDFNSLPKSQAILSMLQYGGQTIMVESPVYFNSLKPVLEAVKRFEMDEFDLANEIIFTKHIPNSIPNYLMITLDDNQSLLSKIQTSSNYHNLYSKLEKSQKVALDFLLKNRLAIIQGPPGSGKTYLGVKIVELLLNSDIYTENLESLVPVPILVLTYKNHALDEFLIKMVDLFGTSEVVRIGGRSQEKRLDECSLFKISRMPTHLYSDIRELQEEIKLISNDINLLMDEIHSQSSLTMDKFFEYLSVDQIKNFFLKKLSKMDKKRFYNELLFIENHYNDLKDYFLKNMNTNRFLINTWNLLLQQWFPSQKRVKELKQLQTKFISDTSPDPMTENNDSEEVEENTDELDEDYINELQTSRQLLNDRTMKISGTINFISDPIKNSLFSLSDFPPDLKPDYNMLSVENIWSLDEIQRIQFIFTLLFDSCETLQKKLEARMCQLDQKIEKKRSLEINYKSGVCKEKKVIGMTITGASIHNELIRKIAPKIIIVEEAAEILEPSLLAALNSKTDHLILIGDQKQLRPQVESFKLRKEYHFDVSMMERLIESNMPYQALEKQNRMRPEFSSLLKSIYPFLEDNLEVVNSHIPATCISSSYFFWSHEFPEAGRMRNNDSSFSRSVTNPQEAEMAATLALFLVGCGNEPEKITILAAYLGQVKLLREKLKTKAVTMKNILKNGSLPRVSTIDMYQGDENNYIIVSLVRSNKSGKNEKGIIGFLKEQNRRCVAQSRAKCSLFFVGNKDTFSDDKGWYSIIKTMAENNCVSYSLPIQCPKHLEQSQSLIQTSDELMKVIANPNLLCKYSCDKLMKCQHHKCKKTCYPHHSHELCAEKVTDKFPGCGHEIMRYCYENIDNLRCEVKLKYVFSSCEHSCSKKCFVNEGSLKCNKTCSKLMDCELHACTNKCGYPHGHDLCTETVKFLFSNCGHESKRKCNEKETDLKCNTKKNTTLKCSHTMEAECFKNEEDINCIHPCSYIFPCKHVCHNKCGNIHNHENCEQLISYKFSDCQHPSPKRKKCSEPVIWKCDMLLTQVCKICQKNSAKKKCHQPDTMFFCAMPCMKAMQCGHPCTRKCSEMCDSNDSCQLCEKERERSLKLFKDQANKRIEKLKQDIKKKEKIVSTEDIREDDETSAEYQRIKDLVLKFIQPSHNWHPTITAIKKVRNSDLELQFEKAKLNCFGDDIAEKFHGTSNEGVTGITNEGFRLPSNEGMYGKGIYFATDSSKSAQEMYTKGSNKLLLCKVLLGRTHKISGAEKFDFNKLKKLKRDSVFAPRDTRGTGGVRFDEFVIFNPAQAYPEYIIHYSCTSVPGYKAIQAMNLAMNKQYSKTNVKTKRSKNPSDPMEIHFAKAEAHYLRMMLKDKSQLSYSGKDEIKSIDVVFNQSLEVKFEAKKKQLSRHGYDEEILAFHGTDSCNIDSILKHNLDPNRPMKHGRIHGQGSYFSEFPSKSQSYGNGLILFRVLPGKVDIDHKAVQPDPNNYMREMIIKNPDQFLPCYVYHF